MPHKRAKASIRKANSISKGHDLPPNKLSTTKPKKKKTSSTIHQAHESQDIPKNMYRILNSEKIRAEYKEKKMKSAIKNKSSGGGGGVDDGLVVDQSLKKNQRSISSKPKPSTHELRIQPGEKLSTFNRRVEDEMRTKVSAVLKTARTKSLVRPQKPEPTPNTTAKTKTNTVTDTTSDSNLPSNDPSTSKPSRSIEFAPKPIRFSLHDIVTEPPSILIKPMKKFSNSSIKSLPISNAQKRLLEEEREKVIKRYREMKEEKLKARDQVGS